MVPWSRGALGRRQARPKLAPFRPHDVVCVAGARIHCGRRRPNPPPALPPAPGPVPESRRLAAGAGASTRIRRRLAAAAGRPFVHASTICVRVCVLGGFCQWKPMSAVPAMDAAANWTCGHAPSATSQPPMPTMAACLPLPSGRWPLILVSPSGGPNSGPILPAKLRSWAIAHGRSAHGALGMHIGRPGTGAWCPGAAVRWDAARCLPCPGPARACRFRTIADRP